MNTEENMSENFCNRVFVGNVPFQCTKEEFQNCFSKMEGFENADIIKRYKSKMSRGFGFVIFETKEQAESLLKRNDIILKDRFLRFSPYLENKDKEDSKKVKLYISGFTDEINENIVKDIFNEYGTIKNIVINNNKKSSLIEFSNVYNLKILINTHIKYKNDILMIKPYNKKFNNYNKLNDPADAYREGFKAGHIVGFQQGYQQGHQQGYQQGIEMNQIK